MTPLPDTGGVCCWGATLDPSSCTCWAPVHDRPQEPPQLDVPTTVRDRMCPECAYRPRSPERTTDLMNDPPPPGSGQPFWCHHGMRTITARTHPSGATVPAATVNGTPAEYDPPIHDGRPYRADGTPARLCAGWAAVERRHEKGPT